MGEYATKIIECDVDTESFQGFSFRSKIEEGDFQDDDLEKDTCIAEIEGQIYKVGFHANGEERKKSNLEHKISILTAIARICPADEVDKVNVVFGVSDRKWTSASEKEDFEKYILPEGEIQIMLKLDNETPPVLRRFCIKRRFCFPESLGKL